MVRPYNQRTFVLLKNELSNQFENWNYCFFAYFILKRIMFKTNETNFRDCKGSLCCSIKVTIVFKLLYNNTINTKTRFEWIPNLADVIFHAQTSLCLVGISFLWQIAKFLWKCAEGYVIGFDNLHWIHSMVMGLYINI